LIKEYRQKKKKPTKQLTSDLVLKDNVLLSKTRNKTTSSFTTLFNTVCYVLYVLYILWGTATQEKEIRQTNWERVSKTVSHHRQNDYYFGGVALELNSGASRLLGSSSTT
jgi:hypothetical protein